MDLGEIVIWAIFGGLAGWIASMVMGKNAQMGLFANVLVGIIGAFIGGWLLPNDGDQFDLGSFIAAVIGAIILLAVVNLLTRGKRDNF